MYAHVRNMSTAPRNIRDAKDEILQAGVYTSGHSRMIVYVYASNGID